MKDIMFFNIPVKSKLSNLSKNVIDFRVLLLKKRGGKESLQSIFMITNGCLFKITSKIRHHFIEKVSYVFLKEYLLFCCFKKFLP